MPESTTETNTAVIKTSLIKNKKVQIAAALAAGIGTLAFLATKVSPDTIKVTTVNND